MGDLYKDDPNSWTRSTRTFKAGYEFHYQYPLQKPRIPSTNLKLASAELNSNGLLSISKPVTCNRISNQKITKSQPDITSYFQLSSDSEEQEDSESESNETVPASNETGVSSTRNMVITDKLRKTQTVRRRLVVPPHREKTKTKTDSHSIDLSYLESNSDSEVHSDSESESNETLSTYNGRASSSTTKMVIADKFRKVEQTVRRQLVVPAHRDETKTKTDSQSTTQSNLESDSDSEVHADLEADLNKNFMASNSRATSSTAKMVITDKFRKVKQTVRRRLVIPPNKEKTKRKTDRQSTTPSNLESNSDSEVQADSESDLNKTVTVSNSRAASSTAKMVITDKFRKVKQTVRRRLVDSRHREKRKTKIDSQPTTPSYLDSNSDSEVHADSEYDLNKTVTSSNSRATSSTAKMVMTDKFRKVKQTFRRRLVVPPHREKTKTRTDSHSITPSYLDSNSDSDMDTDSESDLRKTVTTSNDKAKSLTVKMVNTDKFKKEKQTVSWQPVDPPHRVKAKNKSYSQPTSPSNLDSNSDIEVQEGFEFDSKKTIMASNNNATSSTTKTIISDKFRKVKRTVRRQLVGPAHKEKTKTKTDGQATTPSYVESNSDSEVHSGMESDLNKNFMASNGRAISSTEKMAISGKFRKVKQTVRRQLVAPPFRKKRETKTNSQPATASSLKPNTDSEVQAGLESDLNKTTTPFNSWALSSTTKMVISSMFKKVKQTVIRRFVAPSPRENTVAETAKSKSSWLKKQKNRLLKKYIDRDMSQVGALETPNGVEWKPDLPELIRWKMMASRVRSPLYTQANEDGKMRARLESDNEG